MASDTDQTWIKYCEAVRGDHSSFDWLHQCDSQHRRRRTFRGRTYRLGEKICLTHKRFPKEHQTSEIIRQFSSSHLALILRSSQERNIPYVTIDGIIKQFVTQERFRRRLLESVLWINRVIVDLISYGWTIYRATEIFFTDVYSKLPTCEVELTVFLRRAVSYVSYPHSQQWKLKINSRASLNRRVRKRWLQRLF